MDITKISGFKMSSGEEIIFIGVATGKLSVLTGAPEAVRAMIDVDPFGHMIRKPYIILYQYDGSIQLKRWPRFANPGTCQEIFVPDKDVTFQMTLEEIDPSLVERYLVFVEPKKHEPKSATYEEFMGA